MLGPAFIAQQFVKLIRLADEYDVRIESGRPYHRKWGLKAFLEGVGLSGQADLKLEAIDTRVTQSGTFRRAKRFRLTEYDEVDDAHIQQSVRRGDSVD